MRNKFRKQISRTRLRPISKRVSIHKLDIQQVERFTKQVLRIPPSPIPDKVSNSKFDLQYVENISLTNVAGHFVSNIGKPFHTISFISNVNNA